MSRNDGSYHIQYGWAEGHGHGRKLRKQLEALGLRHEKKTGDADVILAHSGGTFFLPHDVSARLIILVGVPHWPGKHPTKSMVQKVRMERFDKRWFKKTAFNAAYFVKRPKRWFLMWRAWRFSRFPEAKAGRHIIAIRNQDDMFMHPEESMNLGKRLGWDFATLPGGHDDVWNNPKPYVELIEAEYARLLA